MILLIPNKTNLAKSSPVKEGDFASMDIWERSHIETWIRGTPEILGEDLRIVTTEFNGFSNSNDRLDLLALDKQGNLVVIELKRDSFAGYADLQAIRYAAMVSSMTIEKLAPYYVKHRKKHHSEEIEEEDAKKEMAKFIKSDSFTEIPDNPRIILCSEGFKKEITTTVLWLNNIGIDIKCVEIKPYDLGDKIVIVPKTIIPLEEGKQYLIEIKQKEAIKERSERRRRRSTMSILIENNRIKEGDKIVLKRIPSVLGSIEDDKQCRAEIAKDNLAKWMKDGKEYALSMLTRKIFADNHPQKEYGPVNGFDYWVKEGEDETLASIAAEYCQRKE